MQAKIRDSLHKIGPQRVPPSPRHGDSERIRHAQERYVLSVLYPAYGFVYSLARREAIVYPALVRLFQFMLLSSVFAVLSLLFLTPVTLVCLKVASLNFLPAWFLFGPALGVAVVMAACITAVCIHKFKHQVDSIIAVEVARHEGVSIERKVVEAGPRAWIHCLFWLVTLPITLIPLVGIPLFFWTHGLMKAYTFAKARVVVEPRWSTKEKRSFVWRGIVKLQFLGVAMAVVEVIPLLGPCFHFTNLVAKALYVADGLKICAKHP
eukprot:Gregarina_sp_Poly_1__1569@NODE_139_length_13109_cov_53_487809_g124_i0_p8_GENE_NODE_139_length_13109_cov_53_487809_g124_i0NODE_139_length_13109_cov_53_487809_g124_i0_p8_ORF_typecomplete_len265_score21_95EI24/PF07264_11/2_1e11EOS1/PF12326_8/0_018DUF4153/PF13687_6/0_54DUF4153/PF13687_6/1_2e03_NODE_139_length_13109_cov_53_487809_g124_i01131112105